MIINMNLAIICYGEFALEVYEVAQRINKQQQRWDNIFFIERDYVEDDRVINEEHFFQKYSSYEVECVIAIGEVDDRRRIYECYKAKGYRFASLIDPLACISSTIVVDEGVIIFPFVYVAHGAIINKNTILHAHSIVENDCVVGAHNFISLGAFIGAGTKIGNVSFIGPNATIRDKLEIGDFVIVGMGSVVTKAFSNNAVIYGNPANMIRNNENKTIGLKGNVK